MTTTSKTRFTTLFATFALLAGGLVTSVPAVAREGNSMGHGVKCYWVLTSSANGVNTYKQVCRKGI